MVELKPLEDPGEVLSLSDRYGRRELERLLERDFVKIFVLKAGGRAAGFAVVWTVEREAELHWFEVFKPFRGRGLGKTFFGKLLELLRREGLESLLLEVSEKNEPARRVYESFKPLLAGRRRKYYPDGSDALIYLFRLSSS
ncbi:MAG: GNAT family N-acetyltransferase [Aquificae bacterium]|nr:GNAT family N-acetyltransferase [Aquificota bacterium]